jgi:hypothetical protein
MINSQTPLAYGRIQFLYLRNATNLWAAENTPQKLIQPFSSIAPLRVSARRRLENLRETTQTEFFRPGSVESCDLAPPGSDRPG